MASGGIIDPRKLWLWSPTLKTFDGEQGAVAVLHPVATGYGAPVAGVTLDDGGMVSSLREYLTVAPCGWYEPKVEVVEDEGFTSEWVWVRALESMYRPMSGGTDRRLDIQTFSTREAALASVGISLEYGSDLPNAQWSKYCDDNTVRRSIGTSGSEIVSMPTNYAVFQGYPVGMPAPALGTQDLYEYYHAPETDETKEDPEDYVKPHEYALYPPGTLTDEIAGTPSLSEGQIYMARSIPVDYPDASSDWIILRFDPNYITSQGYLGYYRDVNANRRRQLFLPVPDVIPGIYHGILKGNGGLFGGIGNVQLFSYFLFYSMYATTTKGNKATTACLTKVLRAAWPTAFEHWDAVDPLGKRHEGDVAVSYTASDWMFQVRRRQPYAMLGNLGLNYSRRETFSGFQYLIEDFRSTSNDIGSLDDKAYPNGPFHPEDAIPLFEDIETEPDPAVPDKRYDMSCIDGTPIYNN